jgi:nucleotidyltransferase/DNA polymerase involved in DNA repair
MAAGRKKPDGLSIMDSKEERKFIDDSDLEKVPGIGPKTKDALEELGAHKVRDLRKIDVMKLVEVFGRKSGAWLHDLSSGNYQSELGEEKPQDEISRIGTLKEKTRDPYILIGKIAELEKDAREWLMQMKKSYKTVTVIFITEDLKTHTKSVSFRNPKGWSENVRKEEELLIGEFLRENSMDIRRIGIRFGNLFDMGGQTTLF